MRDLTENEVKDDAHTPGPWEWVGNQLESNSPGHYEEVIEVSVSCGSFCYGGIVDMKISDADALLIAAAPDMLFALRATLKGGHLTSGEQAMCAAAVAKATGRSIDEVLNEV